VTKIFCLRGVPFTDQTSVSKHQIDSPTTWRKKDMPKAKKPRKSKKSSVRIRDLKASKDPKGGLIGCLAPAGSGKAKFNE
jgi:hypothetical protein